MNENFEACLDRVLAHEGGYVNDPNDPGGETNMGISRRAYPDEDIAGMTRERAAFLYRRDYWDAVRGDDLPSGVDMAAFDAAVNSGPRTAVKWLQRAVGSAPDGILGVRTMGAVSTAKPTETVDLLCVHRLGFLRSLSTWRHFGTGWTRRVNNTRGTALAMVDLPETPPSPPPTPAESRILLLEGQVAALREQCALLDTRLLALEPLTPPVAPPRTPTP